MKLVHVLAIGAVASLGLLACGGDDDTDSAGQAVTAPPASSSTTSSATTTSSVATTTGATTTTAPASLADALAGTTYVSTSVEGYTLVPGTQITLTFDDKNISATGGCNTLAGTWSVEGDVLVVPPPMAATMMACEPAALMDQDTWLGAVLTSKPTLALDGDTLTITARGATVTLVANPAPTLEGTTWTAESIIANQAISTLPLGVRPPTLRFEGGTVSVDTGCNTGSGSYTIAGDSVTFGPVAITRMACTDPAAQEVEQAVLTVLDGTATVVIDGPVLTLKNGSNGLELRAAPDGATTTTAPAGGSGTTTTTTG